LRHLGRKEKKREHAKVTSATDIQVRREGKEEEKIDSTMVDASAIYVRRPRSRNSKHQSDEVTALLTPQQALLADRIEARNGKSRRTAHKDLLRAPHPSETACRDELRSKLYRVYRQAKNNVKTRQHRPHVKRARKKSQKSFWRSLQLQQPKFHK